MGRQDARRREGGTGGERAENMETWSRDQHWHWHRSLGNRLGLLGPPVPGPPQSQALSAGSPKALSPTDGSQAETLGRREARSKVCRPSHSSPPS